MTPELNAKVEELRQKLKAQPLVKNYLAVEVLGMVELILSKREEEEKELAEGVQALIDSIEP